MPKRNAHSHSWPRMGPALLCLALAGCSGGTPLRFSLSTINGVAFSPRKEDGGRPLANATVGVFSLDDDGTLAPVHTGGEIRTDSAGVFSVRDILPDQTVVLQVDGPAPAAQQVGSASLRVFAVVHLPPPSAPDQPPPAVSKTLDLVSDLAQGAAIQLIKRRLLTRGQISANTIRIIETVSRQVAANACLLPGQECSGDVGGDATPSRDDLINEIVEQVIKTPGALNPPDTGGVGVIVR